MGVSFPLMRHLLPSGCGGMRKRKFTYGGKSLRKSTGKVRVGRNHKR